MDNIDKRLDEILNSLVNQVEWCVNPSAGAISVNREKEQTAQKQAKQAIKQLMIDEFEKMIPNRAYPQEINRPNGEPASVTIDRCDAYNEALDDIRQKIEEWKK